MYSTSRKEVSLTSSRELNAVYRHERAPFLKKKKFRTQSNGQGTQAYRNYGWWCYFIKCARIPGKQSRGFPGALRCSIKSGSGR